MLKIFFRFILISVILILFSTVSKCQRFPHLIFSEIHIVPADSANIIYYSYRIPYNRLVFIKDGDNYMADFKIAIEVTDSASNYIARQSEEKKIIADNFDETNSHEKYLEGVLSFLANNGKFNLLPIISDENSGRDLRLHPVKFSTRLKEHSNFITPVICNSLQLKCDNTNLFELTNFEGSIPFSEDEYFMIISSSDTAIKQIKVSLVDKQDTVYSGSTDLFFDSGISFKECSNKILIDENNNGKQFRNFIIKNFSRKLEEGKYHVYISDGKESKPDKKFIVNVRWFNKPFSLYDPKEAIRILKYAADKNLVDSLLSSGSSKYKEVLFNYWKRFDPTKSTEYNPLMNEFYTRVDYAIKNFSPLSKKNGADTDRGRIYIIYGMPKKIERTSNKYGRMVERWIYEKPDRIFEFVEKDGTGNYTLLKK
jgi:GWxTD domain-containing protein